jgi:hypothetical protein
MRKRTSAKRSISLKRDHVRVSDALISGHGGALEFQANPRREHSYDARSAGPWKTLGNDLWIGNEYAAIFLLRLGVLARHLLESELDGSEILSQKTQNFSIELSNEGTKILLEWSVYAITRDLHCHPVLLSRWITRGPSGRTGRICFVGGGIDHTK